MTSLIKLDPPTTIILVFVVIWFLAKLREARILQGAPRRT
jgi:hypothetical protein